MTSNPDRSAMEKVAGDGDPRTRAGWDEAFRSMARRGDDRLLDSDVQSSSWDDSEWEW